MADARPRGYEVIRVSLVELLRAGVLASGCEAAEVQVFLRAERSCKLEAQGR